MPTSSRLLGVILWHRDAANTTRTPVSGEVTLMGHAHCMVPCPRCKSGHLALSEVCCSEGNEVRADRLPHVCGAENGLMLLLLGPAEHHHQLCGLMPSWYIWVLYKLSIEQTLNFPGTLQS